MSTVLIRWSEAVELSGLGKDAFREGVKSGLITPITIGDHVRYYYSREEIEQLATRASEASK